VLLDLDQPLGHDYWHLMNLAGRYAYAGREWVARKVVALMGAREVELVHNHHNFAWRETHASPDGGTEELVVVRKGATPAFPGQTGFIGGSMGDDAVIVRGVAADASTHDVQQAALFSTVHGAGRVLSRTQAAGSATEDGACAQAGRGLAGDDARLARRARRDPPRRRLDEAPQAYRRLPEVLAAQEGTVEVLHTLRPLVVVMAGADEFDPYKD
jgi:tRNA-splicing ligase RtcB